MDLLFQQVILLRLTSSYRDARWSQRGYQMQPGCWGGTYVSAGPGQLFCRAGLGHGGGASARIQPNPPGHASPVRGAQIPKQSQVWGRKNYVNVCGDIRRTLWTKGNRSTSRGSVQRRGKTAGSGCEPCLDSLRSSTILFSNDLSSHSRISYLNLLSLS